MLWTKITPCIVWHQPNKHIYNFTFWKLTQKWTYFVEKSNFFDICHNCLILNVKKYKSELSPRAAILIFFTIFSAPYFNMICIVRLTKAYEPTESPKIYAKCQFLFYDHNFVDVHIMSHLIFTLWATPYKRTCKSQKVSPWITKMYLSRQQHLWI